MISLCFQIIMTEESLFTVLILAVACERWVSAESSNWRHRGTEEVLAEGLGLLSSLTSERAQSCQCTCKRPAFVMGEEHTRPLHRWGTSLGQCPTCMVG